jgi:hypothetical protein
VKSIRNYSRIGREYTVTVTVNPVDKMMIIFRPQDKGNLCILLINAFVIVSEVSITNYSATAFS